MSLESDIRTEQTTAEERSARWCVQYAEALLGVELHDCERLVTETADLPPAFTTVVENRIAPATALLQSGQVAAAAALLSGDVQPLAELLHQALDPHQTVDGEDGMRVALTHGLTAAWLHAAGWTKRAAASYCEAGTLLSRLAGPYSQHSIDLLVRANRLDPTDIETYWVLANAWYVRSFDDSSALTSSLEAWERGADLRPPDASSSWAYVLRALIGERMAQTDDEGRPTLLWQSASFLERAIMLRDVDAQRWAHLGRLHRLLGNESTSIIATGEGFDRNPEDTAVLEERAAVLADVGKADDALELINARLEQDSDNVWAKGVKAHILMQQKEYSAALALLDEKIAAEPENIWNLDLRAACCWMLGDKDEALTIYSVILDTATASSEQSTGDDIIRAYAAYNLGHADIATSILDRGPADPAETTYRMRVRGLCHLSTGDVTRGEELLLGAIARAGVRDLDELLSMDLPAAEERVATSTSVAGATAAIRRIRRVTQAVLSGLRDVDSDDITKDAEFELSCFVEATGGAEFQKWAEIAARAGLARLQLHEGRWRDAANHYRVLRAAHDFPEGAIGFERAIEGLRSSAGDHAEHERFEAAVIVWQELLAVLDDDADEGRSSSVHRDIGDALWHAGRANDALAAFEKSLATVQSSDPSGAASVQARLALVHQDLGALDAAHASLVAALRLFADAGFEDPGGAVGDASRVLLRDVAHFWEVDQQWTRFERRTSSGVEAHERIADARRSLVNYLEDRCLLNDATSMSDAMPVVTPIAMEVGSDLVPIVDPQSDGGTFLYEEIPAMRQRIERSTGVPRIPGIRVREDDSTREDYVVLLDGAPWTRGSVRVGRRFWPLALERPRDLEIDLPDFEEVTDPVTNMPGLWCAESSWETLDARGATLFTNAQFILRHVEHVLRRAADSFLGIEAAEELIKMVLDDTETSTSVRAALDDPRARLLLARTLRALVREEVPVTDLSAIVQGADSAGWSSVPAIVREVRLRMRTELPGNSGGATVLHVPAEWPPLESAHANQVLSRFDVSPDMANRMLIAIRDLVLPHAEPVVLVTPDAALRPLLRRLIEFEFPSVPVLWRDELLDQEDVALESGAAAETQRSRDR